MVESKQSQQEALPGLIWDLGQQLGDLSLESGGLDQESGRSSGFYEDPNSTGGPDSPPSTFCGDSGFSGSGSYGRLGPSEPRGIYASERPKSLGDASPCTPESQLVAATAASGPGGGAGGGAPAGPAKVFVKIKASHALKKKILRFRSGSLKVMTTVYPSGHPSILLWSPQGSPSPPVLVSGPPIRTPFYPRPCEWVPPRINPTLGHRRVLARSAPHSCLVFNLYPAAAMSNNMAKIAEARKTVEQLKLEVNIDRMKVSQAAAELLAFCETHAKDDPLVTPVPAAENPFRDKRLFCVLL
ncbi:Dapper-like protein 3 [Heterocephalus glaber]|uniref:Guanine nucleotide-binding protein subunit gamma n=2 Tax=Boreoeutheria TaxID=1437010 RepID=G5AUZ6_HETGA|nr:Dapper-like protein 3 [Heterocephalus glaber]